MGGKRYKELIMNRSVCNLLSRRFRIQLCNSKDGRMVRGSGGEWPDDGYDATVTNFTNF